MANQDSLPWNHNHAILNLSIRGRVTMLTSNSIDANIIQYTIKIDNIPKLHT